MNDVPFVMITRSDQQASAALTCSASLEELDASECSLQKAPAWLGACTRLHTLSLAYNKLDAIPVDCSALTALTKLDLSNNQVRHFCHKAECVFCDLTRV